MKTEHKLFFFRSFIKAGLLVSILWAGCVVYYSFVNIGIPGCGTNHFLLSLAVLSLLISVFFAVRWADSNYTKMAIQTRHIDELTGCMTRHAFGQVFEQVLLDTKRSLEPLTILIIDIDRFRLVNERYGNHTGDNLLTMLGNAVNSALRASDITCRWEGDKILVALKECTEKDGCRLAEKILEKVGSLKISAKGEEIIPSISIGVSQMIAADDAETLVSRAETGLAAARDKGRNTYGIGYNWILIEYACDPIL